MTLRQRLFLLALIPTGAIAAEPAMVTFKRDIEPMLEQHCFSCHGGGKEKGGVTLDGFKTEAALRDHKLWLRVLKNTRSHIMPPAEEDELPEADIAKLADWIKRDAFGLDPARLDPGRVTVRRLNRVDYRNTIKELIGVDFDTLKEFPADDTGHGFDNIGDVLTISPMLLEKYLDAAQAIISGTVPTSVRVVAERPLAGREFVTVKMETPVSLVGDTTTPAAAPAKPAETPVAAAASAPAAPVSAATQAAPPPVFLRPAPTIEGKGLDLSYYTPATVAAKHKVEHAGKYQVVAELRALERYADDEFDYNRCRLLIRVDGEKLLEQEFVREGDKTYKFAFDREWTAGEHEISLEIRPLGPDREQKRMLRLRLNEVVVRGPFNEKHWVQPASYAKYFPQPVPKRAGARTKYAQELLTEFATRAYRRPVDQASLDRLVALAGKVAAQPGGTFEAGIAQAMVAVLASPRFIFREEGVLPLAPDQAHPLVDEYALASRLSYFLWSSMPDAELFRLAREGRLRAELPAQLNRMLADPRSKEFIRNFTG